MSKHSPGPWGALIPDQRPLSEIAPLPWRVSDTMGASYYGALSPVLASNDREVTAWVPREYAHLFAGVHDLLAACEELVAELARAANEHNTHTELWICDGEAGHDDMMPLGRFDCAAILAAIAKARGLKHDPAGA